MSKKFEGLDSIFSSTVIPEKPEENKVSPTKGKDDEVRATFIIKREVLEKIKALAYWDRKHIKQVVDDALNQHLSQHGKIKEIP